MLFILAVQVINLQSTAQNLLPMENLYDIKVMSCKVNGLPSKFIIDTGEKEARISITDVLYMLKIGYITPEDINGSEYNQIAAGHFITGTTIKINKIEIGNIKVTNITALVDADLKKPIVLGQAVLSKLGKIEFDYTNQMVTVRGKDDFAQPVTTQLNNTKNNTGYTTIPVVIQNSASLSSTDNKPQKVLVKARTFLVSSPENGHSIIAIESNCFVNVLNNPSMDPRFLYVDYLGLKGYINKLAIEEVNLTAVQKTP